MGVPFATLLKYKKLGMVVKSSRLTALKDVGESKQNGGCIQDHRLHPVVCSPCCSNAM